MPKPGYFNPLQQAAEQQDLNRLHAEQYAYMQQQYDRELPSEAGSEAMRNSAYNYAARMRSATQELYLPQIPSVGQYDAYAQYPPGYDYSQYAYRDESNYYNYQTPPTASNSNSEYPFTTQAAMNYYGGSSEPGYSSRVAMAAYLAEYGSAAGYPGWT